MIAFCLNKQQNSSLLSKESLQMQVKYGEKGTSVIHEAVPLSF